MANLNLTLKAAAITAIFKQVFGFEPVTNTQVDYVEFSFTPEQQLILRNWIDLQLDKKPGDIRFVLSPVLLPWAIKKAMPYILGTAAAGFCIGRKIK